MSKKKFLYAINETLKILEKEQVELLFHDSVSKMVSSDKLNVPKLQTLNCWQLNTCLKGRFFVAFEKDAAPITPKLPLLIPPDILRSPLIFTGKNPRDSVELMQFNLSDNRCQIRYKSLDDDVRRNLYTNEYNNLFRYLGNTPAGFIQLLRIAKQSPFKGNIQQSIQSWLYAFLVSVVSAIADERGYHRPTHEELIDNMMNYIRKNLHRQDFRCEDIAAKFNISSAKIRKLFKTHTKYSLWDTVIKTRLIEARKMLVKGDKSIKEIALLTGWKNQLYFSTAYRKFCGENPSSALNGNSAKSKNDGC